MRFPLSASAQSWTLETLATFVVVATGLWAFLKWPLRGARNALVIDTLRECKHDLADAVLAALKTEAPKHRAHIDALYAAEIEERRRHGIEIAAVRGEVHSIQQAIDGRFDTFSQSVDKLAMTLDRVVNRLTDQGEHIAHMRGQIDRWDGPDRRHGDRRRDP
jgi:hypothetical protein